MLNYNIKLVTNKTTLDQQLMQLEREHLERLEAINNGNSVDICMEWIHVIRSSLKCLAIYCELNSIDLEEEIKKDDIRILRRGYFEYNNNIEYDDCSKCSVNREKLSSCQDVDKSIGCANFKRMDR